MAESEYPILVFPAPARAERARRPSGGRRPKRPERESRAKGWRHSSGALEEALANRRLALQGSSLGIDPEQVLVLETIGSVADFIRAVEKIEGLEWLVEYELRDIAPGDGFEDAKDPEKRLKGQLFLMMSDGRALSELLSLFESWRKDPNTQFRRRLAPFKHAFQYLRTIRHWDVEDRLAETGLLEDWNERGGIRSGDGLIRGRVLVSAERLTASASR